jgi:hypothetical protein
MSGPKRSALGRSFVHPVFDLFVIGGGLSLVFCALAVLFPTRAASFAAGNLPLVVLLANSAHFAASTVRLYTKPDAGRALPFLTLTFPLVALGAMTLAVVHPETLGRNLHALYLTWAPYHYSAQAYGLAVMYAFRSGCALDGLDKKLLWWVSLLPFLGVVLTADSDAGLAWLVPTELWTRADLAAGRTLVRQVFTVLVFAAPAALAWRLWRRASGPLPWISLCAVVANAAWFFVLLPRAAFVWATIFHGLQYLAIVAVFHWKDQAARPGNTRGPLYHVARFYLLCLALGYGLFYCLPHAYRLAGFGYVESVLVVAAVVNLHHFIVDAYIWRLGKSDGNRAIVEDGARPAPNMGVPSAG